MFLNFLVTIVSLKDGMNFKENTTYMKIVPFNGYSQYTLCQKDGNLLSKKTMKIPLACNSWP